MKKQTLILTLFLLITTGFVNAQDESVEVETLVKKISDTEYDLVFEIYIEEDYHLYSQYNPEDASAPMKILAAEGESGYTLEGKAKESKTHTEYSETWEMDEIFFKDEAVLTQRIKVTDPSLKEVTLSMKAQVCLESCLPYEHDFTFALPTNSSAKASEKKPKEEDDVVAKSEDKTEKNTNTKASAKSSDFLKENLNGILIVLGCGLIGGLIGFIALRKK